MRVFFHHEKDKYQNNLHRAVLGQRIVKLLPIYPMILELYLQFLEEFEALGLCYLFNIGFT